VAIVCGGDVEWNEETAYEENDRERVRCVSDSKFVVVVPSLVVVRSWPRRVQSSQVCVSGGMRPAICSTGEITFLKKDIFKLVSFACLFMIIMVSGSDKAQEGRERFFKFDVVEAILPTALGNSSSSSENIKDTGA
jgi:hypothetical protein